MREKEVYEGLEQWLKQRRDEYKVGLTFIIEYRTVDTLLDEVRESGVEGFLPWQRTGEEKRMRLGITGTRHGITHKQFESFAKWYSTFGLAYGQPDELHHGSCTGADEQITIMLAFSYDSDMKIIGHPGKQQGQYLSALLFGISDEIREEKDNLIRNVDIVNESDYLLAFPLVSLPQRYSGTWYTIEKASKDPNTKLVIFYPDGSVNED